MANLTELTVYKSKLMKLLCTSRKIAELLAIEDEPVLIGKDLMYTKIFPYLHIPDTNESSATFICFEVNVPSVDKNGVIKTVYIEIDVVSHQNIMRLNNGNGMRIDRLASEIDKLLNGSTGYGIGKLELRFSEGFTAISDYYGRRTRYMVNDFNIDMCGGETLDDWS